MYYTQQQQQQQRWKSLLRVSGGHSNNNNRDSLYTLTRNSFTDISRHNYYYDCATNYSSFHTHTHSCIISLQSRCDVQELYIYTHVCVGGIYLSSLFGAVDSFIISMTMKEGKIQFYLFTRVIFWLFFFPEDHQRRFFKRPIKTRVYTREMTIAAAPYRNNTRGI